MTAYEKRSAAARVAEDALLVEHTASDRSIAARVGVSQNTVRRARSRLESLGQIPHRVTQWEAAAQRQEIPGSTWRPVPGWEECYIISDHGQLRNIRTGRLMKGRPSVEGYVMYELRRNGTCKPTTAHRLVALAFLGEPNGRLVRHLDDVKNNNHISNLAYGTHRDNAADAKSNGLMHHLKLGGLCVRGHLMTPETMRPRGNTVTCSECRRETHRASRARRAARQSA